MRIQFLFLVFSLILVGLPARGQAGPVHGLRWKPRQLRDFPTQSPSSPRSQEARLPAPAPPETIPAPVPPGAPPLGLTETCGNLPVPLDRRYPEGAKSDIYFELYLHSNPGPVESAIFVNPGGPGLTT